MHGISAVGFWVLVAMSMEYLCSVLAKASSFFSKRFLVKIGWCSTAIIFVCSWLDENGFNFPGFSDMWPLILVLTVHVALNDRVASTSFTNRRPS